MNFANLPAYQVFGVISDLGDLIEHVIFSNGEVFKLFDFFSVTEEYHALSRFIIKPFVLFCIIHCPWPCKKSVMWI